ncbi:hypothetical protein ADH76_11260 [Enterocloster clostridioformis]|nr:hypothetical protein A4V08_23350 [Lachnoclostridium sp. YL32]NDO29450.1 glycosyltransferase family 2 protein [Enterocloster clostridioformis]OXE68988.1 hypothetical protein ADH76_11260 [Enterocloster clostridioformis]QQR02806.1 glycosyltransferase family 2 protein [Enterocloster clostridioformis]
MLISFILPTLNEEGSVESVINGIYKNTKNYNIEILVIDSGTDKTAMIAERLGATIYKVKFNGYGNQVRYGFKKAIGDIVIISDCDGTYSMDYLPNLINTIIYLNYDLVIGNRFAQGVKNIPLSNYLANKFFSILIFLIYKARVSDITTGFKACRRTFIEDNIWLSDCELPAEMIINATIGKYRMVEIPISYRERIAGESKLKKYSMGLKYILFILKNRNRGSNPIEKTNR